ncbi:hypothetical protein EII17_13340 [Clostridiales bacterium COT073_COT-073]|nr:hypothetical protein EII17_13340 [Clostridiales bacterium COT073_COT-073]
MFSEKLNEILILLDVSTKDLSLSMNCARSNISRMRNGKRLPNKFGTTASKLINAIYALAQEKGKLEELSALIAGTNPHSETDLKKDIREWLYTGIESDDKAEIVNEKVPYRSFGEKLDMVMNLVNLSNIQLGKLISLDPSYISRFRNGIRSPKANPKTMNEICLVLLKKINEQNKGKELATLIDLDQDAFSKEETMFPTLYRWLYDSDDADNNLMIEKLIKNMDSFSYDSKVSLLSPDQLVNEQILSSSQNLYFGNTGLRAAALRALVTAYKGSSKDVYLYSDQNIDWLIKDPIFLLKWKTLMSACVKRGIHIRIIHHLDRDLEEMLNAIINWVPLYMSGMIEPYYAKKNKNSLFSHTLFIVKQSCCLEGSNVIGNEGKNGIFRYHTDEKMLTMYQQSFDALLSKSKHLMRVYNNSSNEKTAIKSTSEITLLGSTLSLATMPESTLKSILKRINLNAKKQKAIIDEWMNQSQLLKENLKVGPVYEYILAPGSENIKNGQVLIDIPSVTVSYQMKEYAAHRQNIKKLTERYANYHFYEHPDFPFNTLQILITEDLVAVKRLKLPQMTFLISHPLMCNAFCAYSSNLLKQCQYPLTKTIAL